MRLIALTVALGLAGMQRAAWADVGCPATFCVRVVAPPTPPPSFPGFGGSPWLPPNPENPRRRTGGNCPNMADACLDDGVAGGGGGDLFPGRPECREMARRPESELQGEVERALALAEGRLERAPLCRNFLGAGMSTILGLIAGLPPFEELAGNLEASSDPRPLLRRIPVRAVRPGPEDPLEPCTHRIADGLIARTLGDGPQDARIHLYAPAFSQGCDDACREFILLHELGHAAQPYAHQDYQEADLYNLYLALACDFSVVRLPGGD